MRRPVPNIAKGLYTILDLVKLLRYYAVNRAMIPKMKLLALWWLPFFLVSCSSAVRIPVACSPEKAQALLKSSWEYSVEHCLQPGKHYPLPGGQYELVVEELENDEYTKALVFKGSTGVSVTLVKGERTFNYAVCRQSPQYIVVFDNFASQQNRALLYRITSGLPKLCCGEVENFGTRVVWSVVSWDAQGILLEGDAEDGSLLNQLFPLE